MVSRNKARTTSRCPRRITSKITLRLLNRLLVWSTLRRKDFSSLTRCRGLVRWEIVGLGLRVTEGINVLRVRSDYRMISLTTLPEKRTRKTKILTQFPEDLPIWRVNLKCRTTRSKATTGRIPMTMAILMADNRPISIIGSTPTSTTIITTNSPTDNQQINQPTNDLMSFYFNKDIYYPTTIFKLNIKQYLDHHY